MRIVYMGTPEFAVPPLKALIRAGHTVAGVFCQPDRPKGRGHKMIFPPVKQCAGEYSLPVFQPESLKDGAALEIFQQLSPQAAVVAAYGKILPEAMLLLPRYGCLNIHASLLPQYRGAAPINRAVMNGETKTGVTVMQMDRGMDTGDILLSRETPIDSEEGADVLYERLSEMGAGMIVAVLEALEKGSLTPKKQDDSKATYAPMLDRSLSSVDWNCPAPVIHNQIRGLLPWPTAVAVLNDTRLKLYASRVAQSGLPGVPGQVIAVENGGMVVACGAGTSLCLTELQAEGSRRMSAQEFLRGHAVQPGVILK